MAVRAALSEGDRLTDYPDYFRKLKNSKGGMTSLSEFQGKKPLVVFFYPKVWRARAVGRFWKAGRAWGGETVANAVLCAG